MSNEFTKPVLGTGITLTVPTTPAKSLADLGVSLDPATREIGISFDGDPETPVVIGRYWDEGSTPTAGSGRPIQNNDEHSFSLEQAIALRMIAIGSSMTIQITEYGLETYI